MADKKTAIVLGAGGFIGGHLVKKLKELNYWVRGVDIKNNDYGTNADEFLLLDLRIYNNVINALHIDNNIYNIEVYQLAADMGGAEYIFSGINDANIMHNSAIINLHVLDVCRLHNIKKIFYSSSACIYPCHNQTDKDNPICSEESAYPANPDSEYGWEKLFSERLYLAYAKNYGMDVHIARFHNIFGPYGVWFGGKEKAPSAICRKIALCKNGDTIDIFGDGEQTRSFLYIDECIEGIVCLMNSNFSGPVNIGSDEMVSINQLVNYVKQIDQKEINVNHIVGPLGVRGRNSDNKLIYKSIGWRPKSLLVDGLYHTYMWIKNEINNQKLSI